MMMQMKLWTLVPVVAFAFLKLPAVTHADEKAQPRKLSALASAPVDPNGGENYIITAYGYEYYTPVPDTEMQIHNNGYYTAEVIPVDVKTGAELKPEKNLFVPLHTGYTIGVSDEVVEPENFENYQFDHQALMEQKAAYERQLQQSQHAKEVREADLKNKIPKKFKNQFEHKLAKPQFQPPASVSIAEGDADVKKHIKRYASVDASQQQQQQQVPVYYGNHFWPPQQFRRVDEFYHY